MRVVGGVIKLDGLIPTRMLLGGGIQNYTNEQTKHIGAYVSRAIVSNLRSSFEQFRNAGAQLDSLRVVRGVIVVGVGNLAQTIGVN